MQLFSYPEICFGCSKEPSHWDGSFVYPQHMFWLKNKKYTFQLGTFIWRSYWEKMSNFSHTLQPDAGMILNQSADIFVAILESL